MDTMCVWFRTMRRLKHILAHTYNSLRSQLNMWDWKFLCRKCGECVLYIDLHWHVSNALQLAVADHSIGFVGLCWDTHTLYIYRAKLTELMAKRNAERKNSFAPAPLTLTIRPLLLKLWHKRERKTRTTRKTNGTNRQAHKRLNWFFFSVFFFSLAPFNNSDG